MRSRLNDSPRSRALRAAAVSSALESLETRRLFAYAEVGAPIENAYDGVSLDIAFDAGTVDGEQKILVGKAAENSATLHDLDGSDAPLTFLTPGDETVFEFGYDVAIAGDRLAIAAFDGDTGPVVYVYNSVNGVFDTNQTPLLIENVEAGAADFFPIEAYGNSLLIRGDQAAYVYDLSTGLSSHSFVAPGNGSQFDAIATDGSSVLLASDDGSGTKVLEFAANSATATRELTLPAGGNRAVTLAYAPDGTAFVGDINAAAVYQFNDDGNGVLDDTYLPDAGDVGFGQSVSAISGHLLVGQSYDGTTAVATVFDYTTGAEVQELSASGSTATFGLVTDALSDGFAVGDANANGFTGRIHVFKDEPAPAGPTAVLENGTVTVTGTGAGESLLVRIVNGSLEVIVNGNTTTPLATFSASGVSSVVINAGDGADTVTSDASNTIATEIHGGDGNDTITGGGGDDVLLGEGDNDAIEARQGDDVAVGGAGDDALQGGQGRDVMIGGEGADRVEGEQGDDILVAGFTDHDTDVAALGSIRTAWVGESDYATRVASLSTGLLSPSFVHDDSQADELLGGKGQDWFLADGELLDTVVDDRSGETETIIV